MLANKTSSTEYSIIRAGVFCNSKHEILNRDYCEYKKIMAKNGNISIPYRDTCNHQSQCVRVLIASKAR